MLKLGKYKHYKGKEYEVIGAAKHSETLEDLVVYRALYGEHDLWVRPLKMFLKDVEVDPARNASHSDAGGGNPIESNGHGARKVPRFEFIK